MKTRISHYCLRAAPLLVATNFLHAQLAPIYVVPPQWDLTATVRF